MTASLIGQFIGSGRLPSTAPLFSNKTGAHADVTEISLGRVASVKPITMDPAQQFLRQAGIPSQFIVSIIKRYGIHTQPLLITNPYRLAYDFPRISFRIVDEFAQRLGVALESPPTPHVRHFGDDAVTQKSWRYRSTYLQLKKASRFALVAESSGARSTA
jgi:Helix-hairpin-helix containing domain